MSTDQTNSYWLNRALRPGFTRRHLLGGAAVLGAGAASLGIVGCGDDKKKSTGGVTPGASGTPGAPSTPGDATPEATSTPGETTINKDGILRSRQNAPFSAINPWKGLDSGLTWGYTVFDHLFYTPADTGKPELFLATSMEQPDPLQIVFKIGEAFFHDKPPINGRQVKAADIKASFEESRKQPQITASAWWTQILDRVDVPDDMTVIVRMKSIDAWTFSSANLGDPLGSSIIPEEIAKAPDAMDRDLIGSGRYQFLSHENGTNFKLRRFDNWRIKGEPWLLGIDYKLIQEQAQALAAFSAQEIDSVAPNNKLEKEQLLQRHSDNIEVNDDVTGRMWTVLTRGDGEFADPRVRQAINMALNRQEFIDLMFFGEARKTGPIPPTHPAYALTESELEETLWKFDPEEARALLSQTAFDTTKTRAIKYQTPGDQNAQFAQIIQSQLEKNLGLKFKLVGEDLGTWIQQSYLQSNYDGILAFRTVANEDPTNYLIRYGKKPGGRDNPARFLDDELDDMITKQKQTLDFDARKALILDIQRKSIEKWAPNLPMMVEVSSSAVWKYVKGRVTDRGSYGLFTGRIYIDKAR